MKDWIKQKWVFVVMMLIGVAIMVIGFHMDPFADSIVLFGAGLVVISGIILLV